jgi:hypothetical protein
MQRIQAHKIRIYPDSEQQLLLLRTFGCCRLLYNLALEQRNVFWRPGRLRTIYSRQAAIGLIQHMTYQRNLPVIPPGTAPPPTVDTIRSSMEALRSHSKFQKK